MLFIVTFDGATGEPIRGLPVATTPMIHPSAADRAKIDLVNHRAALGHRALYRTLPALLRSPQRSFIDNRKAFRRGKVT
jgi:hypothetical protein